MERSEPSLVPEWLRSKVGGGGGGGGGLSNNSVSSQAERRSSSNSQRSSSSNGASNRRDKNPYSRSYSSLTRNQCSKDRERLGDGDTWGFEYSDPLASFTSRRSVKGSLGRSKSMISGNAVESLSRRPVTHLRDRSRDINSNGSESFSTDSKVSFETNYPSFKPVERSTAPDITRVPSPGLTKGVQGLSIRSPPLLGNEVWTSALAKVPEGGTGIHSSDGLQLPSDASNDPSAMGSGSKVSNMTEALVQAPARSISVPPAHKSEELSFVGNKKLIPMTISMPQKMVLNPSDKLKPKTAARANDGATGPKNGTQQIGSAQLGSQAVPNGSSIGIPSLNSVPSKNAINMKTDRKTSGYSLNAIPVLDKRMSLAQLRSRNDFLNLMRKKSPSPSPASSSADADPSSAASSNMENLDESKDNTARDSAVLSENGEGKCNGDACDLVKSSPDQGKSDTSHIEVIHTAEELDFLHALGWEDNAGDDEGLTEEEINGFVKKYMSSKQAAKLLRGLESKMMPMPDSQGSCTATASSELSPPSSSQT